MKLSQDEENQLIERVRKNPELARCLLEMTDIIGKDFEKIDLADDAEEVIVNNIRKTGKELLTTWATNKANMAAEQSKKEEGAKLHEKKAPLAYSSRGNCGARTVSPQGKEEESPFFKNGSGTQQKLLWEIAKSYL